MRTSIIAAASATCVLALAACGGAGSSGGGATSNGNALAIKFANCMRAHGVPQFPDPGQGSGESAQDDPDSPAFKSAELTCNKVIPPAAAASAPSESRKLAALKFAHCMRTHGVSDFPDPTLSPPSGNVDAIDFGGLYFVLGSGLDLRSPQIRQAGSRCGFRGP